MNIKYYPIILVWYNINDMEIMRKTLIILIFAFALFSCKSKESGDSERYIMPEFKQKLSVTPKYINYVNKDRNFMDIYFMLVKDDYLLLKSADETNLIQVFNKNTGAYLTGIAPMGRGPGEYPMTVSFFFLDDTLCIYDRRQLIVNYYDKDFINKRIPFKRIKLEGANGFIQIVPYRHGFITAPLTYTRFIIQDKTGIQIGQYAQYPKFKAIDDSVAIRETLFLEKNEIDIKPDHTKLVSATLAGAIIEIFSLNGDRISLNKEIRLLPPTLLRRKDNTYTTSNESYMGFWNIKTTDDYIYMIFSGKKFKDHKKNNTGNYIYVYDWEGNPVKSFQINGGVYRFALDEDEQRIYLINFDKDGNERIGYFDL
ncbi:TolB-like 6-blade propeller-like protein [anaerobic digester metagenome]